MARGINKYSEARQPKKVEVVEKDQELLDAGKKLASQIEKNFENRIVERTDYMKNTHMRTSFLFRKDLKERLDKLSDKNDRGFRTQVLNDAIEFILDGFEEKE